MRTNAQIVGETDARSAVRLVPVTQRDGARLEVTGAIDLATAVHLLRVLRQALRAAPATIELDVAGVEFIDVAGMRSLISCRRIAHARRVELVFVGENVAVRRLAGLMGLPALADVGTGN
ncbi:MAG: STAS domain-containing protein [Solirubrobacteraceae bacterium]